MLRSNNMRREKYMPDYSAIKINNEKTFIGGAAIKARPLNLSYPIYLNESFYIYLIWYRISINNFMRFMILSVIHWHGLWVCDIITNILLLRGEYQTTKHHRRCRISYIKRIFIAFWSVNFDAHYISQSIYNFFR